MSETTAETTAEIDSEAPPAEVAKPGLPSYMRSLLRVSVPVCVQLATKKESVREIVEMAPGSILSFEKACDQALQLSVSGHIIAEGEAVKIGEKFGFRVSQVAAPDEKFRVVRLHAKKKAADV